MCVKKLFKLLCTVIITVELSDVCCQMINRKLPRQTGSRHRSTETHARGSGRGAPHPHDSPRPTFKDRVTQLHRHSRDVHRTRRAKSRFGKAVYFGGKQVLKLARMHRYIDLSVIKNSFTVDLWIKPEGGQYNPVHIIEMTDACSDASDATGWAIGIATVGSIGEQNARFFFSLRCGRSRERTTIYDNNLFEPNSWLHVTASFNGSEMVLYVNEARKSVSHSQIGGIFPMVTQSCKTLRLGGAVGTRQSFRGTVDELKLWRVALTQRQISEIRTQPSVDEIVLKDDFNDIKLWTLAECRSVEFVPSDIPTVPEVHLTTPPCGQTVCDDPNVVLSYTNNWQLRTAKRVRYRIVNIMNDDSSQPTVTTDQITRQHEALNDAFLPYNISFELDVASVKNTSLNQRFVMFGCDTFDIGNGKCNPECQHARTGNDGGDCDPDGLTCDSSKLGDGECDDECNRHYHRWDGGDCCLTRSGSHSTCFDPFSPYRGYISISELKHILQFDSTSYLNVFFMDWTVDKLIGVATFPWEKHVYSIQGGTVVQPVTFGVPGEMSSLVHEIGHSLGLWHVHRGVSEVECGDPCAETVPSMTHGDLCADTLPTPKNQACHDPELPEDVCGVLTYYRDTPFRNYMSYTGSNCTSEFTPQQTARMHCYLDLVYQVWRTSKEPSPVPLAPKIASSGDDRVTLVWTPPLVTRPVDWEMVCSMCTPHGSIIQNAINASSPAPTNGWSPEQATGPPDAEKCDSSPLAWMPDVYKCGKKNCRIDLYFKYPVVPERLTVWVVWNAANGMKKLKMYFEGGRSKTLKNLPAQCDVPFTTRLSVSRKLTKIRIYTRDQYVAIDAVEIVSRPNEDRCRDCRHIKYKIHRKPPFHGEPTRTSLQPAFTDFTVKGGRRYRYWVEASHGTKISQSSPSLYYTHGQPYCGDGLINKRNGEVCDDGNLNDGDGCSTDCQVEISFHCVGSPSLCYLHDGDGVCEEFEKRTSIRDCGFYTPEGYIDQQASWATSNPDYQDPYCPETAVLGHPDVDLVYFARKVVATEVIIHISSDGSILDDSSIQVDLIRSDRQVVTLQPKRHTISCSANPLHVPVIHDLSQPFFFTTGVRISFSNMNISISAVRLRSSRYLDPITLASCSGQELYNPRNGRCVTAISNLRACPDYILEHGVASCSGKDDGDVCTITCEAGYEPVNRHSELICSDGQWLNSTLVACRPVDCGLPYIPHATVRCPNDTILMSTCYFDCVAPAIYHGTSNAVQCDTNGLWTTRRGSCIKQCPEPPDIPNAKLTSRKCKRRSQPLGTKCKYRCYKGYHAEGGKPKKRFLMRTCGQAGEWRGPLCEKVKCPPIDLIYNDQYTCTDGTNAESVCTLSCYGGQRPQRIQCMKNGNWDGRFKVCTRHKVRSCSRPVVSGVEFRCTQSAIGSRCRVKCRLGTHEATVINRTGSRLSTGTRVSGDVIHDVVCTATRGWIPDPRHIVCVKKCLKDRRGDGWCDGPNNRDYCDWDDGDCCPSTLKTDVLPFSSSCTEQCTCKDPNAIENKTKSKRKREARRENG